MRHLGENTQADQHAEDDQQDRDRRPQWREVAKGSGRQDVRCVGRNYDRVQVGELVAYIGHGLVALAWLASERPIDHGLERGRHVGAPTTDQGLPM